MRSSLVFIAVVFFLGTGCRSLGSAPLVSSVETDTQLQTANDVATSTRGRATTFRVNGFELTAPAKWKFEKVVKNTAYLKTEYKPYNVYVTVEIERAQELITQDDLEFSEKEGREKLRDGTLYETGGSGLGTAYFVTNNGQIFSILWGIESDQPVPKDLDGVWGPDHNVTREDRWSMMRSLQVITR